MKIFGVWSGVVWAGVLMGVAGGSAAGVTVSLSSSAQGAGAVGVGTVVVWTAVGAEGSDPVWYRFRVGSAGGEMHVVRDYAPSGTIDWAESEAEGTYEMEATARDNVTGETAVATESFTIAPVATGGTPVISGTGNPLVYLYSAPACGAGQAMRVEYQRAGGAAEATPYKDCGGGRTMNFYVAGLRASSVYTVRHAIARRGGRTGVAYGPAMTIQTPAVALTPPAMTAEQGTAAGGMLLLSRFYGPSMAVDLAGNLIWYYAQPVAFLTDVEGGGKFLALTAQEYVVATQYVAASDVLREFDVAGNTLRETNAARLREQLAAMGKQLGVLHHDARGAADGTVMVLGTEERMLYGVQGSGSVDVIGDLIIVMDRDMQVKWVWDAFDHLDPHRMATMGETCPGNGCPPLSLAGKANDWVHGDAVQFLADGNILYSSRHQDWVMEIDYRGGKGDGSVVWRMGQGGDFQIESSDASPWFSHQHDAEMRGDLLTVFDDGNVRRAADAGAHSRGQALRVDLGSKTAELIANVDLGGFAFALGTSEVLEGGGFYFGGGWFVPANASVAVETDGSGNEVWGLGVAEEEYRSYLLEDLYTSPERVVWSH